MHSQGTRACGSAGECMVSHIRCGDCLGVVGVVYIEDCTAIFEYGGRMYGMYCCTVWQALVSKAVCWLCSDCVAFFEVNPAIANASKPRMGQDCS